MVFYNLIGENYVKVIVSGRYQAHVYTSIKLPATKTDV